MSTTQEARLTLATGETVAALWTLPPATAAVLVLAHGAGAGMHHAFLGAFAGGLAARSVAVLRYRFAYMERGTRRVDPPPLAHAAVRAACAEASRRFAGATIVAGGKSFGGRMTSQAGSVAPLAGIAGLAGLAFIGFALHPAGKPAVERARHLERIARPMLFLQGTRDTLASLELREPVVAGLGAVARLVRIDGADHGFHVLARSGRTDAEVEVEMLDALVGWIGELPRRSH